MALSNSTTYEYGTRQGIDGVLREIEQSGRSATSLLVTRGHVELEIFVQPTGTTANAGLGGGPVGTYASPPVVRDSADLAGAGAGAGAGVGPSRGSNAPPLANDDANMPTVTLNAQLDMDFSGEAQQRSSIAHHAFRHIECSRRSSPLLVLTSLPPPPLPCPSSPNPFFRSGHHCSSGCHGEAHARRSRASAGPALRHSSPHALHARLRKQQQD
jgi:hypothetical protein